MKHAADHHVPESSPVEDDMLAMDELPRLAVIRHAYVRIFRDQGKYRIEFTEIAFRLIEAECLGGIAEDILEACSARELILCRILVAGFADDVVYRPVTQRGGKALFDGGLGWLCACLSRTARRTTRAAPGVGAAQG